MIDRTTPAPFTAGRAPAPLPLPRAGALDGGDPCVPTAATP
ncbi:hypothetical protein [Kineococcus sp. SYSU DK005]